MRYELRLWTDNEHIDYIIKATSDEADILRAYIDRPSVPSKDWYRYHIVDTETENA